MPATRPLVTLLIAAGIVLAGAADCMAFSKLGREDGTLPAEDGVIATPLPPLAPTGDDAKSKPPESDTAAGSAGAPSQSGAEAEQPPVAPPAAPSAPAGDGAAPAQPDVVPPPVAPPAPPDAGSAAGTPDAPAADEEGTDPAASQRALPTEPTGPPPNVVYGDAELPAPVRDLRAKLLEIAKTGDIEKLRPYLEPGDDGTVLSFGGVDGDPIDFLKSASGDGEGVEVLAILLEVLQAGHFKSEPGTDNEIYIWPYFAGLAIDKLTKPQKVELFELVTAGDYQEMVAFGAYNFYRVGISPDGKLQFFVAGD